MSTAEDNPLAAARRAGADLARVFGGAPGSYGAQAADTALDGQWRDRAELGEAYLAAVDARLWRRRGGAAKRRLPQSRLRGRRAGPSPGRPRARPSGRRRRRRFRRRLCRSRGAARQRARALPSRHEPDRRAQGAAHRRGDRPRGARPADQSALARRHAGRTAIAVSPRSPRRSMRSTPSPRPRACPAICSTSTHAALIADDAVRTAMLIKTRRPPPRSPRGCTMPWRAACGSRGATPSRTSCRRRDGRGRADERRDRRQRLVPGRPAADAERRWPDRARAAARRRLQSRAGGRLADLAQRLGNGHIDLTRRANLQLRGLTEDRLPELRTELATLGLLDPDTETEAVRNVMVAPLAGLDPTQPFDVRPIARAIDDALTLDKRLHALPGKFGLLVDGGGTISIASRARRRLPRRGRRWHSLSAWTRPRERNGWARRRRRRRPRLLSQRHMPISPSPRAAACAVSAKQHSRKSGPRCVCRR